MSRLILIFLLIPIGLVAQENVPFNLNNDYISNPLGYDKIKTVRTNKKTSSRTERIHSFNENGVNNLTTSYYGGEKQTITKLRYDSSNRLIGFKTYGTWAYLPEDPQWDSTALSWQNKYSYHSNGKVQKCTNQWFNKEGTPTWRTEVTFKYDSLNRIVEETEKYIDLSTSLKTIQFEPNSIAISPNQILPDSILSKRIFSYKGDSIIIENYKQQKLKTHQVIATQGNKKTEVIKVLDNGVKRTTIVTLNKRGQVVKEVSTGDLYVSIFEGYGDVYPYDIIKYKLNGKGLLKQIKYINTKHHTTYYVKYKYIKKKD